MNSVKALQGNFSHYAALSLACFPPSIALSPISFSHPFFTFSFLLLAFSLYSHPFLSIPPISLFLFIHLSLPLILCQFFPHPPSIFFTIISHLSCLAPSVWLCRSCRCFFFFFLFSFAISSDLIQLFLYLCSRFSLTLHSISLAFSFLSATHSPLFHSLSLSLAQPTISVLGLCLSSQSPSLFRLCSKALLNEMIQMAFYGAVQHNQAEHGRQS